MMKILNCSTWNNLKRKFLKPCLIFFSVFSFSFGLFPSVASAAPAVVPVGVELIGELLVALGLMVGNATDGYIWKANDNPYVSSIFEEQIKTITSGVPISSETLGQLSGTVIPDDVYTTDGTKFYVGKNELTTSDLFLNASSLAGVSYAMPVNVSGAQNVVQYNSEFGSSYADFPLSDVGGDYYFFPYFITDSGSYVNSGAIQFLSKTSGVCVDFVKGTVRSGSFKLNDPKYLIFYTDPANGFRYSSDLSGNQTTTLINPPIGANRYLVSGNGDVVFDKTAVTSSSLLRTTGYPTVSLVGNKDDLKDAVVQVKKDDDNNGSTPPTPQSPNSWEIWQTVAQLLDEIESGNPTNNGTNYQQYVNNNYNYVQVDVNLPEKIDADVNLSGGLDINGKGDININFNEDVSLPDAGDGSGFYNPNAADVVGALNNNNPVISGIKGLFAAIDPALVGVFSVSVSLMLVLGLWKLIRG